MKLVRSPKQLGVALRTYRRDRGLTQAELSARAGLRQATISQIETGHEAARLSTILAILRALDLELSIGHRTKSSPDDIEALF